jgi:hypothetical protein
MKLNRGEKQQFGPWLRERVPVRSHPGERKSSDEKGGNNSGVSWAPNKSGGSGSDSRSYRKDGGSGVGSKQIEKGQEATSPLKKLPDPKRNITTKKLSFIEEDNSPVSVEMFTLVEKYGKGVSTTLEGANAAGKGIDKYGVTDMQGDPMLQEGEMNIDDLKTGNEGKSTKTYRKRERKTSGGLLHGAGQAPGAEVGAKRGAKLMDTKEEIEEKGGKKLRSSNTEILVGLPVKPCADQ